MIVFPAPGLNRPGAAFMDSEELYIGLTQLRLAGLSRRLQKRFIRELTGQCDADTLNVWLAKIDALNPIDRQRIETIARQRMDLRKADDSDRKHPTWLIGHAAGSQREFIVRTKPPRFSIEVFIGDEPDADPFAGGFSGTTADGSTIGNIVWFDSPPPAVTIKKLLARAIEAYDHYCKKVDALENDD
jgi:hypothetical protein